MRLDPTLMTNASYLASYPQVAAFVARYPDVPRNPGYYLERYESNYSVSQPTDAKQESLRMWRDALEFMAAFTVFCVVLFALFSLIRYVVDYRRWHRISRLNAEVHNEILDRFASNEELLAYVDSPAGRRFLEATPIAPNAAQVRSLGAPFGRILPAVRILRATGTAGERVRRTWWPARSKSTRPTARPLEAPKHGWILPGPSAG